MLSREVTTEQNVRLNQASFSICSKVGAHNVIENSFFGKYFYCEPYTMIQNTIIRSFVDITRNIYIGTTRHPLQRPTIHHITYRRRMYSIRNTDDEAFFEQRRSKLTEIRHDVWAGHGASIEAGMKVGNGAVIGSGAIITHDIPSYAIVTGTPAKIPRFHFDCEQIAALLGIAWWNWKDAAFRSRIDDLPSDIDIFTRRYKKG